MRLPIWTAALLLAAWSSVLAAAAPDRPARPAAASAPAAPADAEFFEKKIRPILSQHCTSCHSGTRPQGGLDLKTRKGAMVGGTTGPAVVAGDPDASAL